MKRLEEDPGHACLWRKGEFSRCTETRSAKLVSYARRLMCHYTMKRLGIFRRIYPHLLYHWLPDGTTTERCYRPWWISFDGAFLTKPAIYLFDCSTHWRLMLDQRKDRYAILTVHSDDWKKGYVGLSNDIGVCCKKARMNNGRNRKPKRALFALVRTGFASFHKPRPLWFGKKQGRGNIGWCAAVPARRAIKSSYYDVGQRVIQARWRFQCFPMDWDIIEILGTLPAYLSGSDIVCFAGGFSACPHPVFGVRIWRPKMKQTFFSGKKNL